MLVLKAKKGQQVAELLDEDDPELLAAEQEKQTQESQSTTNEQTTAGSGNEAFDSLYEEIQRDTANPKEKHILPKHSRLNNLLHHVSNAEQVEKLPNLIEQWRNKLLPITETTSHKAIDACCRTGRGDVAFTLLGERQKYGLLPDVNDFEKTIKILCEQQSDLDKAFLTLAMVPLYKQTRTGAMYASLLESCVKAEETEKAALTAEEFVTSQPQDITNRADAKDALANVAKVLAEQGEQDKAQSIQEFITSL